MNDIYTVQSGRRKTLLMQSKNENEISLFHQIFCCQKEYFGEIALRGMLKKTRTCSQCITSKGNNLRSNLDFQMLNIL